MRMPSGKNTARWRQTSAGTTEAIRGRSARVSTMPGYTRTGAVPLGPAIAGQASAIGSSIALAAAPASDASDASHGSQSERRRRIDLTYLRAEEAANVRRAVGIPLALGIGLAILVLVLAVGWQILVLDDPRPLTEGLSTYSWLMLILGTVFFALVLAGLVALSAWLVREMRLNQRQRAFLDAVTHEMRTPLASLRLYLDTLGRHDPDPEQRRAFVTRMQRDVDRLEHTVAQVLHAARAEEPRRKLPTDHVLLAPLLDECIEELRTRHELPAGAVQLEARAVTVVRGNRAELAVVFRNLLENAAKYSDAPVAIRVRVSAKGEDRVDVAISDRGIGIPARELRKIFQRFYRAGRDVQRTAAGLGLGLFIVRSLVRRQGGRVIARSEGSGAGSRFVVTLRAAEPGGRPLEGLAT